MQILSLLGMYFDAVVVEVEKYLLFFRLALAILCCVHSKEPFSSQIQMSHNIIVLNVKVFVIQEVHIQLILNKQRWVGYVFSALQLL